MDEDDDDEDSAVVTVTGDNFDEVCCRVNHTAIDVGLLGCKQPFRRRDD